MIFIEKKYNQNSYICLYRKKTYNKKKKTINYFLIKIKNNIIIKNFIQINFKKNKKKIFFFFSYYILQNNFKIKLNNKYFLTNSFIY
ncbi:hypothetical protein MEJ65_00520 [Candidatus Carsonella ruddii]|uniref:Uncharacterized protein n=1 Tax=Carsonella ruddii TaxID=114186 RepID=A0AAJ6FDF3_CARRU|nr:hypothetical protein [Candidatus Carsonella ruddii]WGS66757.1 hypothetical protein MEJ66_00530 [Candidatus Carsonella ruddii]WGS66951.1 hypothetical protein MEJ62_00515 [Candidatus Carsonella ruddii]WGS67142.1 hypothetical protein MEJ60_00515 [Candidatus Carsonella ruddii]WGS67334.1 hypothetical protein MEJ65_00520 [Candidatus Carsonella ruddii]WMC18353.1 MAG: hypothetical protein NU472_00525 [Candidatus Carsonella ruddii]